MTIVICILIICLCGVLSYTASRALLKSAKTNHANARIDKRMCTVLCCVCNQIMHQTEVSIMVGGPLRTYHCDHCGRRAKIKVEDLK